MNDYIATKISISPVSPEKEAGDMLSVGDASDIVAALLAENGYESFQLEGTELTAYIPEKDFFELIAEEPFENICNAFLLKGGHDESSICTDKLYYHSLQRMSADFQSTSFPTLNNRTQPFLPQDLSPLAEEEYLNSIVSKEFRHKRIFSTNTHGSGCILSTAIACYLAQEYYLEKAVEYGLKFTYNALKESTDFQLGKGTYGPALV